MDRVRVKHKVTASPTTSPPKDIWANLRAKILQAMVENDFTSGGSYMHLLYIDDSRKMR